MCLIMIFLIIIYLIINMFNNNMFNYNIFNNNIFNIMILITNMTIIMYNIYIWYANICNTCNILVMLKHHYQNYNL